MWAPSDTPEPVEKRKRKRGHFVDTSDLDGVEYADMTRAQLCRAIRGWQEDDRQGYSEAIELLCEAVERLEQETYHDGVGVARCPFCFQERKA